MNPWTVFWSHRDLTSERDRIWYKNMQYFIKSTYPLIRYNHNDIILDIGCGPGYFEHFLCDNVKEIHGVDVSSYFLDICNEKFKNTNNVFFHKLNENSYTKLSKFQNNYFSKIICHSVVQYYQDISEIEELINEVKRISTSTGLFLISDIPYENSKFTELFFTLTWAIREKCFFDTVKYLSKMRTQEYQKVRSKTDLLYLSQEIIKGITEKYNLNSNIIFKRLSLNRKRYHWLIKF